MRLHNNKQQSNIAIINSTVNKSGIYLSQLLKNEMTTQHISDIGAYILEYVCGVLSKCKFFICAEKAGISQLWLVRHIGKWK